MRGDRWWMPLTFIAPCGVLAWLGATQSPAAGWLLSGGWAVLIVATLGRALRPRARGHRVRAAAEPTFASFGEVQSIYLGLPDVGPVAFGPEGPPGTELVIDTEPHDPADVSPKRLA